MIHVVEFKVVLGKVRIRRLNRRQLTCTLEDISHLFLITLHVRSSPSCYSRSIDLSFFNFSIFIWIVVNHSSHLSGTHVINILLSILIELLSTVSSTLLLLLLCYTNIFNLSRYIKLKYPCELVLRKIFCWWWLIALVHHIEPELLLLTCPI